jgi:Rap1a immunity proteins
MKLIVALAVLLLASGPAIAQRQNNAIERLPGCREADAQSLNDAFEQGVCLGEIVALIEAGPIFQDPYRFCKPPGATAGQAKQVIVSYIETVPTRMRESFVLLAVEALARAWPCGK